MIETTERTRSRWLWLLTALTAAFAMANVIVFYTTDGFGDGWFAAGIAVYTVLFVSALALSLADTEEAPREAEPEEVEVHAEDDQARMIDHDTIYKTPTGRVLRGRFAQNGTQRSLLFSVVDDEVLPISAVEERLATLDVEAPEIEEIGEVERALERRSSRDPIARPDPAGADVEIVDREVLHESPEGRILRVRYRVGDEDQARLFAITEDSVVPVGDVEGSLDEVRVDEVPVEAREAFEAMLSREAEPEQETPSQTAVTQR